MAKTAQAKAPVAPPVQQQVPTPISATEFSEGYTFGLKNLNVISQSGNYKLTVLSVQEITPEAVATHNLSYQPGSHILRFRAVEMRHFDDIDFEVIGDNAKADISTVKFMEFEDRNQLGYTAGQELECQISDYTSKSTDQDCLVITAVSKPPVKKATSALAMLLAKANASKVNLGDE